MTAYAIYRLPHEDHATLIRQTDGEPVELHSLTELNGRQGFVVAPFEVTAQQPILVIRADEVRSVECGVRSEECGVGGEFNV
jgi:isochorismate synthase